MLRWFRYFNEVHIVFWYSFMVLFSSAIAWASFFCIRTCSRNYRFVGLSLCFLAWWVPHCCRPQLVSVPLGCSRDFQPRKCPWCSLCPVCLRSGLLARWRRAPKRYDLVVCNFTDATCSSKLVQNPILIIPPNLNSNRVPNGYGSDTPYLWIARFRSSTWAQHCQTWSCLQALSTLSGRVGRLTLW